MRRSCQDERREQRDARRSPGTHTCGLPQPTTGWRISASTGPASPKNVSSAPSQSTGARAPRARAGGTATATSTSVTSTNGTLIAKIQRHEAASTSQPPTSGPITVAIPDHAVHEPIAAPRSSGRERGDDHRQRARRQQRAEHALQRAAGDQHLDGRRQRAERARRRRSRRRRSRTPAARRRGRRASRRRGSASRASAGSALETHCWPASPPPRSSRIAGSATLTDGRVEPGDERASNRPGRCWRAWLSRLLSGRGPSSRTFSTWTSASRSCVDPVALVLADEPDAPGQRLAAAAGDAGVDEGVEHPALGHPQPGHDRDAQVGEDGPRRRRTRAPRDLAAEARPRPRRRCACAGSRVSSRKPSMRARRAAAAGVVVGAGGESGSARAPDDQDLVPVDRDLGRPGEPAVGQPAGEPARERRVSMAAAFGTAGLSCSRMAITLLHHVRCCKRSRATGAAAAPAPRRRRRSGSGARRSRAGRPCAGGARRGRGGGGRSGSPRCSRPRSCRRRRGRPAPRPRCAAPR